MTEFDPSGQGSISGSPDVAQDDLPQQIIKLVNIPTFRTAPFDLKNEKLVQD